MSGSKKILPAENYFRMLDETDLITNVGNVPDLNLNKNKHGIEYETKYINYTEKEIKALAKAHLYLASLKPKFKEIEYYLRWHPNSPDAKAYKAALELYTFRMNNIRSNLKNKKTSTLPLSKEMLEWSKFGEKWHQEMNIPAAKLMLEQMNREKQASDAQANLVRKLDAENQELYQQAKLQQNKQLREAGIEPTENVVDTFVNNLSKQQKEEANKAWAEQRQELVNIIEGKEKSPNNYLRNAGVEPVHFNSNNSFLKEVQANHRAYLNKLRANKQKRNMTRVSRRKNRKTRRLTRRT
jgi:hypothetical protein